MKIAYSSPPRGEELREPSSVSLRHLQVVELLSCSEDVLKAAEGARDISIHLGRCTFLQVQASPRRMLDIRDHYFPELNMVTPQPTRRGVRLYELEIFDFLDIMQQVKEAWPALETSTPCKASHTDDVDASRCYNCNPRISGTPRNIRYLKL